MSSNERKKPSFLFALLIMAAVCVVVIVPYMNGGYPWPPPSFLSWLFVIPACMSLGFTYEELEKAAVSYCGKIITSVFILLSVGGMIGAWIAAGTVSAIVDVGLRMITPQNFSSGYVYCRSVVRNGVRYFLGDIRHHWYCDVCRGTGVRSSPGHDSRSSGQCRVPGGRLFSDVGQP